MKRIVLLSAVFLMIISGGVQASVAILNYGSFENNDISFNVFYDWGNSTPTPERAAVFFSRVKFEIVSKRGSDIYNRSYFVFEGREYIFNSSEIKNSFYKEGYRELDGKKLDNGSIIKLVYEINKKGSESYIQTRKVEKKFKIILSEDQSKGQNIIKIVELKK